MIEALLLLTLAMPPQFPGFVSAETLGKTVRPLVNEGVSPGPAVGSLGRVGNPFEVPVGMMGERQMAGSNPAPGKNRGSVRPQLVVNGQASITPACLDHAASAADESSTSRLDLALGVTSLSAAMIATGLTSSCLAAKTCHETVPLTRWAFDRGPVWGVTGRAAVNGLIHYGVARWVPKGKWRTATLAVLAAINVTNAVLDIRTLQKIERDR